MIAKFEFQTKEELAKDILETLEKLNKEKEPKRDSAVAEYIKGLLEKQRQVKMIYFKVKKDADALLKNELLTRNELIKGDVFSCKESKKEMLSHWKAFFEKQEIKKTDTYWMFGCRWQKERGQDDKK